MKAYRGSRGTYPVIPRYDCGWWWVVIIKPRPLYPREITLVLTGGRVGPRAGRVFFSGKDRNLMPLPRWWSYQISRNCVSRFRSYWTVAMRTWYGVYLAFIVQWNGARYFCLCRAIARHVLVVHRMCKRRRVLFVYMWSAIYCLLRCCKCLEIYALRRRKIPHSLAHIPTVANG